MVSYKIGIQIIVPLIDTYITLINTFNTCVLEITIHSSWVYFSPGKKGALEPPGCLGSCYAGSPDLCCVLKPNSHHIFILVAWTDNRSLIIMYIIQMGIKLIFNVGIC